MTATPEAGVIEAYSTTGDRWQAGPGRIYDRLSEMLVADAPVPVAGARVLDVGAGTGAACRAVLAAGAGGVVALDPALGMLAANAHPRAPAVVADARALPLREGAFDLAVAAFSLNHLADPQSALQAIGRVLRTGGGIVAGTYASDDTHPVKEAVEQALRSAGWEAPDWFHWVREHANTATETVDQVASLATAAGMVEVEVEHRRVPFPELTPHDLISWRFGMAQHAPFLRSLSPREERGIVAAAVGILGDRHEPLVRSVLILRALTPAASSLSPRGRDRAERR